MSIDILRAFRASFNEIRSNSEAVSAKADEMSKILEMAEHMLAELPGAMRAWVSFDTYSLAFDRREGQWGLWYTQQNPLQDSAAWKRATAATIELKKRLAAQLPALFRQIVENQKEYLS